nr:hypothetical protein [Tanacetum cinerariifolium]
MEEQAAQSLLSLHTPKRRICETPSPVDAETGTDMDKVISEGDTEMLNIDELGKQNVDAKFVSMVNDPIHQASTSVPPLSTPIFGLSPLKLIDSPLLEPLSAATSEITTTTLPLPPPP